MKTQDETVENASPLVCPEVAVDGSKLLWLKTYVLNFSFYAPHDYPMLHLLIVWPHTSSTALVKLMYITCTLVHPRAGETYNCYLTPQSSTTSIGVLLKVSGVTLRISACLTVSHQDDVGFATHGRGFCSYDVVHEKVT